MSQAHREALARVIDPGRWEIADNPKCNAEAVMALTCESLEVADRIIASGLMASMEWDRREYLNAMQRIRERTSTRGHCYSVDDLLDGYFMHDPRCGYWPDGAIGGSSCIKQGRR